MLSVKICTVEHGTGWNDMKISLIAHNSRILMYIVMSFGFQVPRNWKWSRYAPQPVPDASLISVFVWRSIEKCTLFQIFLGSDHQFSSYRMWAGTTTHTIIWWWDDTLVLASPVMDTSEVWLALSYTCKLTWSRSMQGWVSMGRGGINAGNYVYSSLQISLASTRKPYQFSVLRWESIPKWSLMVLNPFLMVLCNFCRYQHSRPCVPASRGIGWLGPRRD